MKHVNLLEEEWELLTDLLPQGWSASKLVLPGPFAGLEAVHVGANVAQDGRFENTPVAELLKRLVTQVVAV